MKAALQSGGARILDRVIRPQAGGWLRPAAKAIMGIHFDAQDQERMSALLDKAKAGDLSPVEAEEAEHYRQVGRLLEMLKSRARHSLRNKT